MSTECKEKGRDEPSTLSVFLVPTGSMVFEALDNADGFTRTKYGNQFVVIIATSYSKLTREISSSNTLNSDVSSIIFDI